MAYILLTEKESALQHLEGRRTLDLARYEIGNVVWKESVLFGNISDSEARAIIEYTARIIGQMRVLRVETPEDSSGTMKLATEHGLTYYDAAYAYHATSQPPLVTEDMQLLKKAGQIGIEAITVSQLLEGVT